MLEFGGEDLQRVRLRLPYENAVSRESEPNDYLADGNALLPIMDEIGPHLDSITHFDVWDAIYHFFLSLPDGSGMAYPEDLRLVEANEIGGKPISACANPESETMYSLPGVKQNDILKNLRLGLFHKSSGDIITAFPYLSSSWQEYQTLYQNWLELACNTLSERINAFKSNRVVTPLTIEIPAPLRLSEEECPGFHLAECLTKLGKDYGFGDIDSQAESKTYTDPLAILDRVQEIVGSIWYGKGDLSLFYQLGLLHPNTPGFSRNPYVPMLREAARSMMEVEGRWGEATHSLDSTRAATEILRSVCETPIGRVRVEMDDARHMIRQNLESLIPYVKNLQPISQRYIETALFHQEITIHLASALIEFCRAIECELVTHVLPKLKDKIKLFRGQMEQRVKDLSRHDSMKLEDLCRVLNNHPDFMDFNTRLQSVDPKRVRDLSRARAHAAHHLSSRSGKKGSAKNYSEVRGFILDPKDGLLPCILDV